MPTANGSSLSSLSDADLVSMLNAGQPSNANQYTQAIGSNESNNASDSATGIVNPASGARGSMQVKPTTAIDPGYGVTPSNGTPEDDARMGRDYYNALNAKYGDPTTAAIAYDWGPGNTDKWLKSGGDLSKVPAESLAYALNFNNKTGAGNAPVQSGASQQATLPSTQFDQFLKQNPTLGQNDSPANAQSPSIGDELEGAAAGLGRGVQSAALGAQALVGKGAQALGLNTVGNWLVNDAQQGNAQGEQDFQAANGNTLGGTVGKIAGQVAPALLLGPEALPQVAGASVMGAGDAALNNENIAKGAVGGAAGGALGVAGGHALAGIAGALSPAAARLMAALRGGDDVAAANIAKQLAPGEMQQVIDNLRANAQSPIDGVNRTAAEAADNTTITKIQRAAQNTPEGQSAITGRLNDNNVARMQAGQNAVGPSANNSAMMGPGLEAEQQAFTQTQAARVAQGQTELNPVDATQAAAMQTPEYQRAINGARRSAANAGQSAFTDQTAALNQGLADQIDQVAGTPETLQNARNTRQAQANVDYAGVNGDINADTPAFNDLQARPGFNQALRRAAGIQDNMEGSAAADAITQAAPTRSLQAGPDGMLNWVEQPGARTVDAGILQGARSQLSSMANKAALAGDAAEAQGYRDTLAAVDNFLGSEQHAGPDIAQAFNRARANYSANSVPIDQQTFLQTKLAGAVNNLTGEVNPGALNSTINSVARGQLKPGLRPEDRITPDQLAELQNIGEQARAAPTNMQGLSPEGQELIRQQLAQNASKSADAQQAFDAMNQYLGRNAPSYAAHTAANETTGASLGSRQALSGALDKMSEAAHNASGQPNLTYSGAKSALRGLDLQGQQADYARNLLDDLQRSTAANASVGAAGSQTSANEAMKGKTGLVGGLLGHLGGSTPLEAAITGGEAGGHLGAIAGLAAQKLVGGAVRDAQAKTVSATIDLLRNPLKLAAALEKYQNQPQAATAFINALKTKALKAGKAGAVAVQAYEAATS
jgi:hypothetical protein